MNPVLLKTMKKEYLQIELNCPVNPRAISFFNRISMEMHSHDNLSTIHWNSFVLFSKPQLDTV